MGSSTAPEEHQIQIKVHPGSDPHIVLSDITTLNTLQAGDFIKLARPSDEASLTFKMENDAPNLGMLIARVADDLSYLQQHTTTTLLMPDMQKVSDFQIRELHALANIYRDQSRTQTGRRFFLNIEREDQIPHTDQLSEERSEIFIEHPEFELGDETYLITRRLAREFKGRKFAEETPTQGWKIGDSAYLVPDTDNTVELVAVQNDNLEGTAGDVK